MSLKKFLAALLLAVPMVANAATVTHAVATTDTTNDPNTSAAFTPASNDFLVVGVCATSTVDATPTLTSSVGGKTFSLYSTTQYGSSSIHRLYVFVADQLASNTSQDVTFTAPNDTTTGTIIMVERVASITRTGSSAIKQFAEDANQGAAATPDPSFASSALTGNPTIGFLCNTTVTAATVTPPTNWTEQADVGHATPDSGGEVVTRDSGFTGTQITWGSTFGSNGGAAILEIDTSSSAATFTAAPAQVAVTPVSVQISFTSDTTATVKGVFCANGSSTPSAAEVLAGQCAGGGTALASYSEAVTATVADGNTISGLTPGTIYDTWHIIDATTDSSVASLPDQTTSAVAFTSNPSCSAATNGASCTYTTNASGTVYGVGVNPGDGTPTCSQIKAGNNDGGTAALWAGSDANTLNVSDTVTVTGTNKPIRMNMHFCANASGADSSVYSGQTNINRSAKAGFAIVVMASHSAAGLCNLDSYFNPDCADGDVFEYEDDTNESADCNVSIGTNGELTLTPVAPGNCDGRQTFEISYQDVGNATTGLFIAPTTGTFATDDTVYINNSPPVCSPEPEDSIVVLTEDVAMTARDLGALGGCTDADSDTITYSVTVGSLPAGTSLGGTGNKDWTGTPNTENEAGTAITITATDVAGDTDTFSFTVYVVNTWTVPNIVGLTISAGEDAIVVAAPWRENNPDVAVTAETCSSEPAGEILTQSPAAAAQTAASTTIEVTIAKDCAAADWVSYSRVWMFREVRKVYLTTTAFKRVVELEVRNDAAWARWAPGTLPWSGSSNMQIDVRSIPGVPPLTSGGQVAQ